MRHRVFALRLHLAECFLVAVRHEHRVVAEALVSARRPDEFAVDPAFEIFDVAIGPGKRKTADEMGARVECALLDETEAHALHREVEILLRACPARRIDARRSAKRLDAKAGIVGKRRLAACLRGGERLQLRIGAEGVTRLFGLVEPEIAGGQGLDAERCKQFPDLADLAAIMAGDNERLFRKLAAHRPTAFF